MSKAYKYSIFGIIFLVLLYKFGNHFLNNDSGSSIRNSYADFKSFSLDTTFTTIYTTLSGSSSNLTITIGTVVCSRNGETTSRQEAAVMMKSTIISSKLYNVSKVVFYLFLEHEQDSAYFSERLQEFESPFRDVQVELRIRSAISAVPEKYRSVMVDDDTFRCMYIRLFFPTALADLDSILYFDTDIIVTGSIADVWNYLGEMDNEQLIGVGRSNEGENPHWLDIYHLWFEDIPHIRPKGLISGILLMNLTRMRDYKWEEKLIRLYNDYSRNYWMNDQRLLNILLYFDQGLLKLLPCQYMIRFTHCERGLYCKDVEEAPKGIQLLHGAANHFSEGHAFRQIYLAYQNFNMRDNGSKEYIDEDLMKPIKIVYAADSQFNQNIGSEKEPEYSKCFGILDKLLFKNIS